MQAAMTDTLTGLHICTDSPEPLLLVNAIITKISVLAQIRLLNHRHDMLFRIFQISNDMKFEVISLYTRGDQKIHGKVLLNHIAFINCNENSQI